MVCQKCLADHAREHDHQWGNVDHLDHDCTMRIIADRIEKNEPWFNPKYWLREICDGCKFEMELIILSNGDLKQRWTE